MEQIIKELKELNELYCADIACRYCPFYINPNICYIDRLVDILDRLKEKI